MIFCYQPNPVDNLVSYTAFRTSEQPKGWAPILGLTWQYRTRCAAVLVDCA